LDGSWAAAQNSSHTTLNTQLPAYASEQSSDRWELSWNRNCPQETPQSAFREALAPQQHLPSFSLRFKFCTPNLAYNHRTNLQYKNPALGLGLEISNFLISLYLYTSITLAYIQPALFANINYTPDEEESSSNKLAG
jgi:hypothetical protein